MIEVYCCKCHEFIKKIKPEFWDEDTTLATVCRNCKEAINIEIQKGIELMQAWEEKHKDADCITYYPDSNKPIEAVYYSPLKRKLN